MKNMLRPVAAALAVTAAFLAAPAQAAHQGCHAMHVLNHDGDGTLDWRETRRAAVRLFYKLDPDRDGTLDRNELRGRVGILSFARFNPDRDGTLDKHEFLALVKHRFHRANPDRDGTVDCNELSTLAGRRLLKVLM